MNFLDKLTKAASELLEQVESAADKVNKTVDKVNKTYKAEGAKAVLDKTVNKVNNKINEVFDKAVETSMKKYEQNLERSNEKVKSFSEANTTEVTITEEAKPVIKSTSIHKLQNLLSDGEIANYDATPLEILMEEFKAQPAKRIPGKYTTQRNNSVVLVHNKWFCFNGGAGGEGAVSFTKFIISGENCAEKDALGMDDELTHDALTLLKALHSQPTYQQRVSDWIRSENERSEKRVARPKKSVKKQEGASSEQVVKPSRASRKKSV